MSTPQFTPGPYLKARTGNVLDRRGCKVATIEQMPGNDPREQAANGDLIASAPELYAALKSLVARLDSMTTEDFVHCQYHIDKTIAEHVLAKAEGRAPKAL